MDKAPPSTQQADTLGAGRGARRTFDTVATTGPIDLNAACPLKAGRRLPAVFSSGGASPVDVCVRRGDYRRQAPWP